MINTLLVLPLLAAALPKRQETGQLVHRTPECQPINHSSNTHTGQLTAADIIKVAPQTASCSGRGAQCVTAAQAAPAIANSFKKYGIVSFGSQAAVLSTILYESDNFAYDAPVSPVPGKGTRNMQSAEYNGQYASAVGIAGAGSEATDDTVVALNKDLDTSFGSGAWFLAANCPMSVRDQMHAQQAEGYQNYVEQCLGTSEISDRAQIWNSLLALKQW